MSGLTDAKADNTPETNRWIRQAWASCDHFKWELHDAEDAQGAPAKDRGDGNPAVRGCDSSSRPRTLP